MNNFKIEIDNFTYHVEKLAIKERKVFWSVKDLGRHNASGKTNNFYSRNDVIEYIASLHPQEEK
jgi:formate dehydrogenase assembly factor FdhD